MITCIINGHKAYPISTSSIKVTYANQYVTDDGEYTYDITFPMNILENRVIFKNVSRLEVKKNIAKYDDCKLYCNSQLIMSGVGTILSVNEKEIKLQIVGGKSRIKFNDRMEKHYIDEIQFGTADQPGYDVDKGWSQKFKDRITEIYRLDEDKTKFLGVEGKWCFVPVRDETNDMIANFVGQGVGLDDQQRVVVESSNLRGTPCETVDVAMSVPLRNDRGRLATINHAQTVEHHDDRPVRLVGASAHIDYGKVAVGNLVIVKLLGHSPNGK